MQEGTRNLVVLGVREMVRMHSNKSLSLAWVSWDMVVSIIDWTITEGKEENQSFKVSSFISIIQSAKEIIQTPIIFFLVCRCFIIILMMHNSHVCFSVSIVSYVYIERFCSSVYILFCFLPAI